jgi:hypothetical protein
MSALSYLSGYQTFFAHRASTRGPSALWTLLQSMAAFAVFTEALALFAKIQFRLIL